MAKKKIKKAKKPQVTTSHTVNPDPPPPPKPKP
jgi:hypothetical protein